MKTKLFTIAEVPKGLEQAWLQHLRDFDTANPDCHFVVCAEAPDASMSEIMDEMLKINPPLSFTEYFERSKKTAPTDSETATATRLIEIMVDGRVDDVTGEGRSAECWCSNSNGSIDIADIFAAFEQHYTLVPKERQ